MPGTCASTCWSCPSTRTSRRSRWTTWPSGCWPDLRSALLDGGATCRHSLRAGRPPSRGGRDRRRDDHGHGRGFRDFARSGPSCSVRSAGDCVFLTWEWLRTWWKHLGGGRRLFDLIAVRQGESSSGSRRLRSARAAEPPGPVSRPAVPRLGQRGLRLPRRDREGAGSPRRTTPWRDASPTGLVLDLAQVHRGPPSATVGLAGRLARRGWRCPSGPADLCPFIDLTGLTWASYLATLGRGTPLQLKRRLDDLDKAIRHALRARGDGGAARRGARDARRAPRAALERARRLDRASTRRGCGRSTRQCTRAGARARLAPVLPHASRRRAGRRASTDSDIARTFGFYQTGFDPAYARHGVGR